MRTNTLPKTPAKTTHEGAPAKRTTSEQELRRSVMACMLWEDSFYESGVSIAERIKELVPKVSAAKVAEMAVEARSKMNLRHVPLLMVREMARHESHRTLVANTLEQVIQRADELAEFLNIYWTEGRTPVSAQVKKGLAKAFLKFDEYALAKFDFNNSKVKLRDVLFICHAKPKNKTQEKLWKKLAKNELKTPDTWETQLSAGKDKKATFTRLIKEDNLGALAFLRNLRNMTEAGVDEKVIDKGFSQLDISRVLPFRFITAARHAPQFEPQLETTMFKSCQKRTPLKGKTLILVDVSGSMESTVSDRSEVKRLDAACGLAMIAREICDKVEVWTFSEQVALVPARRGFALRDAINNSQPHGGTDLGTAVDQANKNGSFDRVIVLTDEQSHTRVSNPDAEKAYMINVAAYQNGIGYGKWVHLDGWADAVLDYIVAYENQD